MYKVKYCECTYEATRCRVQVVCCKSSHREDFAIFDHTPQAGVQNPGVKSFVPGAGSGDPGYEAGLDPQLGRWT